MSNQFAYLKQLSAEPAQLMRGLQLIQAREGFISDAAVQALGIHFHCTTADVESILNFYPQFRRIRPGKVQICVCGGSACRMKNGALLQWLKTMTQNEKVFSVETVDCLGSCQLAPALRINGHVYGKLDKSRLSRILAQYKKEI